MMFKRLSVALFIAANLASVAAAPTPSPASTAASTPGDETSLVTRHVPLSKLGNQSVLRLRTTDGSTTVNFGNRVDEQIVKAVLKLRYSYSPSLIPEQSHIRVLLNQEVVGVVPVTREGAGRSLTQELDIDPRFITGFNQMTLQFIGHYTAQCEDPLHSSLWADISGTSELALTVRKLPLSSDLAMLPEPFFDARSEQRLTLPFVFGAAPSQAALRAAAITSSWFGKLAAWRGARFPAALNVLPREHAVVFATNTERPAGLGAMPAFKGPAISVMTNPADGRSKLLLISGRDGADLATAATALALGNAALSGDSVAVVAGTGPARPRQAYDAPNWVRLDRPVKFGELIDNPQQLQAVGHQPQPVRVNVRIPPDLFAWHSRGVAVNLKFRYTAPTRAGESRLVMSINDELVDAVNLRASGQTADAARVVLPLLDDVLLSGGNDMRIPAFKLGARNEMQYGFSFARQKEGQCRDAQVENVRAMIDPDSTIDFSGYPHYAEMPQLNYFTTAGFPFTKYADLAGTAVVMPRAPNAQDIEVMLALLGRMGESTGYPATRVQVIGPDDSAAMQERDLLLIGTSANQPLFARWSAKLPAMIDGDRRRISQPVRAATLLFDRLGFGTDPDPQVGTQEQIVGSGPLALLTGFESPLTSGRSVVAVTAARPEHMLHLLDVLEDRAVGDSMRGSAVFVRDRKVDSMLTGSTYTIGALPFWTTIWYPLSGHPILLALLSVLAVIIFAFALWRALRAIAQRRLNGGAK